MVETRSLSLSLSLMMEEKRDVGLWSVMPPAPPALPRSGENFILLITAHLMVETSQMTDRSRKYENLLSQTWLVGLRVPRQILSMLATAAQSLQISNLKLLNCHTFCKLSPSC